MKKIYVLVVYVFSAYMAWGQVPLLAPLYDTPTPSFHSIKPTTGSDLLNAHDKKVDDSRELTYYWVNYSQAVDYAFNGGTLENIGALPLWPDSLTYIGLGDGTGYYWNIHGYSSLFDPASNYIADWAQDQYVFIGSARDQFNTDHAFDVDSVGFYYYYDRNNTGYTDTLKVYVYSPGSTAIDDGGYYFDSNGNGAFDEGEEIGVVLTKYNSTANKPNGTYTEYTYLLSNDDTASYHIEYKTIPLNFEIPKGPASNQTVGIAFQFRPGQPYALGDTLLDYTDPPVAIGNPLNRFWLITYEEIADSDPLSWDEYSNNQDGVATSEVRYNLSPGAWNGFYISTYAYTAPFSAEHAFIDWYVAPKGANYISSNTTPCQELTKAFSDLSNFVTGASPVYYWDFDDGANSTEKNPTHTWAEPGTYNVCEVVTDGANSFQQCKNVVVTYCTDVDNIDDLSNFTLYPNPAKDQLNVELQFSNNEDVTLSIQNIQGQTIYTQHAGNITSYNKSIDISTLAAGMYMLRVDSNGKTNTQTFIVTK